MKTLEKILFSVLLTILSYGFVQAKPHASKSINQVLVNYIECTTTGNLDGLYDILNEKFRHTMNRNGEVFTANKDKMIKFLKSTKNKKQNCSTSYSLVEKTNDSAIAKVIMRYPTFTKVDYVTLCAAEKGWQVSHVLSTYP